MGRRRRMRNGAHDTRLYLPHYGPRRRRPGRYDLWIVLLWLGALVGCGAIVWLELSVPAPAEAPRRAR
ncbi:MAG TPA: hypothetical protein VG692_13940 [Gemmatimonadales bacterium]|nr:hypothetical protein [Gemmatimonadales bacterium]